MNFNQLTDAETERLALLIEECGEVAQAAGKILRHGWQVQYNGVKYDNRQQLLQELGDLHVILGLLLDAKDISAVKWFLASEKKRKELRNWTHHQPKELFDANQVFADPSGDARALRGEVSVPLRGTPAGEAERILSEGDQTP